MNEGQRRGVIAIFLYTCVEGLVVNFLHPNPLAYLPKDVMIALLYASMILNPPAGGGSIGRINAAFAFFVAVCVLYVAFPTPVTPMGISVALKQRLLYIPLIFVGYHYIRGDADLARLLRTIAWSSIPVSLFGIYLFFGGPFALRDMGADYSHTFFSTMGASGTFFYRVPGTFNSPGQFGAYLSTVGTLLVGFMLVKDLGPKDRRMILLAMACLLPAMLVTGSRAPLIVFLLLAGLTAMTSRKLSRAGIAAAVLYVLVVISLNFLGSGVADRLSSIVSAENVARAQGTLLGQLWIPQLFNAPLGEGLGVATVGARHFSPVGVRLVESYLGLITTEMGFPGLAAFLLLVGTIIVLLIGARRWMVNAPARPIWNAGFLFVLVMSALTSNGTGLDAIPLNLYYWFFIGVLLRLADLERQRLVWAAGGPTGAGV
jgi:hypothetical protein